MQACCGAINGDGMQSTFVTVATWCVAGCSTALQIGGKFLLECFGFRPRGNPTAAHGVRDGGNFFFSDIGAGKGDESGFCHK